MNSVVSGFNLQKRNFDIEDSHALKPGLNKTFVSCYRYINVIPQNFQIGILKTLCLLLSEFQLEWELVL